MRKKFMIVVMAAISVLFCGCGNDGGRADKDLRDSRQDAVTETPAPTEAPTAVPTEEPKPVHNFNVTEDVLFTYEYDKDGELSGISRKGFDREYVITNIIYDKDGCLSFLEANYNGKYGFLKAEYNSDGQIIALEDTYTYGRTSKTNYKITYNSSTGYIKVVLKEEDSDYPGETTEYDSNLNKVYYERYYLSDGIYCRRYSEYSNDIEVHRWDYYSDGKIRYEYLYYDNGNRKEYYEYNKQGKAVKHEKYDRTGQKVN